ncbi:hypothetical protein Tco_1343005 [Tanacetum coccineum]
MAERTMKEILRAPTEGYGEAIVLPEINADHFEIKTNLLQLVQASPFHGYERENPHAPINSFKRITSTLRFRDVSNDVIKLMIGGNLLSKTTREALNIIENKSKVHYSRNKSNVSRRNTTSRESVSKMDERIDKLADQLSTLVEIVSKKVVTPASVKAVEEICVTCSGPHAWYNCPNTDNNQSSLCAATGSYNQVNPSNHVSNQMAPPGIAPVQNNGQNSNINPPFKEMLEDVESKDSKVSNIDEPVLLNTPLFDEDECFDPGGNINEIDAFLAIKVSTKIKEGYYDLEGDVFYLESFLSDDTTHNLSPKVFFDHEPQCFKDESEFDTLKNMVKDFDPGI